MNLLRFCFIVNFFLSFNLNYVVALSNYPSSYKSEAPKEILKYFEKYKKNINLDIKKIKIKRNFVDKYYCEYVSAQKEEVVNGLSKNGFGHVEKLNNDSIKIHTVHGTLVTNHPLIIDLINSKAFQRLKKITQYGICEKIESALSVPTAKIGYTRYQHCLGNLVLIARYFNKEGDVLLNAMVAGMLHDISHTVFSHSLDMILAGSFKEGYHDRTLESYMQRHGIGEILKKYDRSIEMILPHNYAIQEPINSIIYKKVELYADRLEYIIYAMYKELHFSFEEIQYLYSMIRFDGDYWYFDDIYPALMFSFVSIWNSEHRWGGIDSSVASKLLEACIYNLIDLGKITAADIDYNLGDDEMFDLMSKLEEPRVKKIVDQIKYPNKYFELIPKLNFKENDEHYLCANPKLRIVNPLVKVNGSLLRLDTICHEYKILYNEKAGEIKYGFYIKSQEKSFPSRDNKKANSLKITGKSREEEKKAEAAA